MVVTKERSDLCVGGEAGGAEEKRREKRERRKNK
jgi:hypothetical protein